MAWEGQDCSWAEVSTCRGSITWTRRGRQHDTTTTGCLGALLPLVCRTGCRAGSNNIVYPAHGSGDLDGRPLNKEALPARTQSTIAGALARLTRASSTESTSERRRGEPHTLPHWEDMTSTTACLRDVLQSCTPHVAFGQSSIHVNIPQSAKCALKRRLVAAHPRPLETLRDLGKGHVGLLFRLYECC